MARQAISLARLMRESTDQMELALRSEDNREHLVAHRIFESPNVFHSWELEHSGLMRNVADSGAFRHQAETLRQTNLRLIHTKALFEYLRRCQPRGMQREKIMAHFHPTKRFNAALLQEHGSYIRRAGSHICTTHLGADFIADPTFLDPMRHYEELYTEYFHLYCATMFPEGGVESASTKSLLPLLKHQLNEWRWIILNPRAAAPKHRHESEIRVPLGDTQRLPTLKIK